MIYQGLLDFMKHYRIVLWRKDRDSNPGNDVSRLTVFEALLKLLQNGVCRQSRGGCGLLFDIFFYFLRRKGFAEIMALQFMAAPVDEIVGLCFGFDTFAHNANTQIVGHLKDCGHQGFVAAVPVNVGNKNFIYFQNINRQVLELHKR